MMHKYICIKTSLKINHKLGTSFCDPIGHIQEDGDYRFSWQPHSMSSLTLNKSQAIAKLVTDALGGYGIFGVELFIKGDVVYFNEVSPRPHDTGMVTLVSQNINEFELHLRAILCLPIPLIKTMYPSVSAALLLDGDTNKPSIVGLENILGDDNIDVRIFGKPDIHGRRRMGVVLSTADTIENALSKSKDALNKLSLAKD
jgi:phosphoribosylglycinamide formyltransferase 2